MQRFVATPSPPVLFKQPAVPPNGDEVRSPKGTTDAGDGDGRRLVCAACGTAVTRPEFGMAMNGKRVHVFFNPHGDVFEVGCFSSAGNLLPAGPKTDAFTWFAGYVWQATICAGCGVHLGWRYSAGDDGFHSLILAQLAETDEPRS